MNLEEREIDNIKMQLEVKNIMENLNVIACTVNEKDENRIQLIISENVKYSTKTNTASDIFRFIKNNYESIFSQNNYNKKIVFLLEKPEQQNETKLLSEREKEVLSFLALGKRYKQIADALFISVNTVHFHIKNIYKKLNIHSQLEAVNIAAKMGLIASAIS